MNLRAAFATDDGNTLMGRHFGDAKLYDIYDFDGEDVLFFKRIQNTIDEAENVHADPHKAKGISALLMHENVTVVVSRIFGPNIKRIRKKFVCIVTKEHSIKDAIHQISMNMTEIEDEWVKAENRSYLTF